MDFGEGFDLGSPDPDAAAAVEGGLVSEEGFFGVVEEDSHRDLRWEEEEGGGGLVDEGFGGLPPAILLGWGLGEGGS